MSNVLGVLNDSTAILVALAVIASLTILENWSYWSRSWRIRRPYYVAASLGIAVLVAGITIFSMRSGH